MFCDTYVAGLDLSIPTIASIMGHFVVHVLTEAETVDLDTNLDQEQVDAANKVTERLVVNDFLEAIKKQVEKTR